MFKKLMAWIKAKLFRNASGKKSASCMTSDYITYKKQELVVERQKEYEDALVQYGDNPEAKNYLILLKHRVSCAENISNEFQLNQEMNLPKLSTP